MVAHFALGERRHERGDHCHACRGTVLGNSALRHMHVHIVFVKEFVVDVKELAVALEVLQRNHGALLHHVAQVAGEGEFLALATRQGALDEEDFTTHGSPCQSCHHAGKVVALVAVAAEVARAQELLEACHIDALGIFVAAGFLACHLAQHLGNLLLELAHTALAGVAVDNLGDSGLGEGYLFLLEAVLLQLLGNEMLAGNLDFLLGDVAVDLYHLHAVEQGLGDGAQVVGSGNEQHLRQVVVHVKVVVVEVAVLLGVEHLEQCRGGVALEVLAHLVDLVENNHGVAAVALHHRLDNAAGHSANVGAAVTANLGFVVKAAQRDALILAVQRLGDGASQRCLAHARRAIEADDGRLEVAAQLENREVLENAVFHILQAVVVAVELCLHLLEVEVVGGILVPWQVEHGVEVGILCAVVGRLLVQALELLEFFVKVFLGVLVPLLLLGAALELGDVVIVSAQLFLDGAYLLLQEVLALLLRQVLACAQLDAGLQVNELSLLGEDAKEVIGPVLDVALLQQGLLAARIEGDVGGKEVNEVDGVVDVADGKLELAAGIAHLVEHVEGQLLDRADDSLKLPVVLLGEFLLVERDVAPQVRLAAGDILKHEAGAAMENHVGGVVGQLEHLDDLGNGAHGVEVIFVRVFYFAVNLANYCQRFTCALRLLDGVE